MLHDMASNATVGKTTSVPPAQLNLFHRNPRKGDTAAIASSLRRHSQYKPITANLGTHTGRPHEVLAGNHTLLAFRQLAAEEPDDPRWHKMLVHWIDVDDDMCERIVVADNQTSQLGGFDTEELVALIEGFGEDIEGLGFTEADIADLNALVEEQEADAAAAARGNGSGGETGPRDDGLINAKDMTQRRDEYADQANNRMVVLTLPIARFVWVQGMLEKARAEYGVETNTDAVVALLETWSGETAPEAEAEADALPDGPADPVLGDPNAWDGSDPDFIDYPADPEGLGDDAGN